MDNTDLEALAGHHARQGLLHAKSAMCNAPWYHAHERDTRRAAEHFAVSAAIREHLKGYDHGR